MAQKREKSNYLIQSVSHAVDVLEELANAGGEIGVTELSKRLKLHKNNVFRLLATLELRGFVEQNSETEDYRLGAKALQIGQAYISQSTLVERATPLLRSLSETIGETVSLAVLQNGQVQFPVCVESKRPVKVAPRIATSLPAKQCPAGRLLMAQLPDDILDEMLAENTPHDAAIRNQRNELRSTGQVIDRGATEADVVSVVKVIRSNKGIIGAIEVLIPQYRAKVEEIMSQIDNTVSKLSAACGAGARGGLDAAIEKQVTSDSTPIQVPTTSTGISQATTR